MDASVLRDVGLDASFVRDVIMGFQGILDRVYSLLLIWSRLQMLSDDRLV